MKTNLSGHALILIIFLALGCQDTTEKKLDAPSPSKNLNEHVGKRISLALGEEWIANYNKKYSTGREGDISYSIDPPNLEQVLNSVTNITGLFFHYALDDQGELHIIIIPVDQSLLLWPETPGILVDANTNSSIEQDLARTWVMNYRNAYPDQVRSHFFGINIFREVQNSASFNLMELKQALNDSDVPQLLLLAWSEDVTSNGRTNGDNPIVYDESNGCPPWCKPNP